MYLGLAESGWTEADPLGDPVVKTRRDQNGPADRLANLTVARQENWEKTCAGSADVDNLLLVSDGAVNSRGAASAWAVLGKSLKGTLRIICMGGVFHRNHISPFGAEVLAISEGLERLAEAVACLRRIAG